MQSSGCRRKNSVRGGKRGRETGRGSSDQVYGPNNRTVALPTKQGQHHCAMPTIIRCKAGRTSQAIDPMAATDKVRSHQIRWTTISNKLYTYIFRLRHVLPIPACCLIKCNHAGWNNQMADTPSFYIYELLVRTSYQVPDSGWRPMQWCIRC
jgi:hypothetical protein